MQFVEETSSFLDILQMALPTGVEVTQEKVVYLEATSSEKRAIMFSLGRATPGYVEHKNPPSIARGCPQEPSYSLYLRSAESR